MYRLKGKKVLKDIRLRIINLKLKLKYDVNYNLDWMSIHYGEDEVVTGDHSYFHSGPRDVTVKKSIVELYLNNKLVVSFKVNKKRFKKIINKFILEDARVRKY